MIGIFQRFLIPRILIILVYARCKGLLPPILLHQYIHIKLDDRDTEKVYRRMGVSSIRTKTDTSEPSYFQRTIQLSRSVSFKSRMET